MFDKFRSGVPGRREFKYLIDSASVAIIKSRLSSVLDYDSHYSNGKYFIRSVYFDDLNDTAYNEKMSGINDRRKIRARFYNFDNNFIVLEKKVKSGDLVQKHSARISDRIVNELLNNDLIDSQTLAIPGFEELYYEIMADGCKPVVIVDYDRTAWQIEALNVRITVDENIRASESVLEFFNKDLSTFPVMSDYAVLEVKYDDYFPDFIVPLLSDLINTHLSVSKYILCRDSVYGFKNRI